MHLFSPARRYDPNSPELMDRPDLDPALLREELEALENANRRFGGDRLLLDFMHPLLRSRQLTTLRVLDLATGGGDTPRCIAAWCREHRFGLKLTAVDRNPDILRYARQECREWPEIQFEQHDLRDLPHAAGSFDVVLCSLALHHFTWKDAVTILRRMQEIAAVGYIANDLRRNWPAIWTTQLLARCFSKSAIFRHDAVQSCRAAFTFRELRTMAQEAGLNNFKMKKRLGVFRMILLGRK